MADTESPGLENSSPGFMQAFNAAQVLQHGQDLQKQLKDLQPTLLERIAVGLDPQGSQGVQMMLQMKTEQRRMIMQQQQALQKALIASGQPHLALGLVSPLKPEQMQALIKMDAATPRAQVTQAMQSEVHAPVGSEIPTAYATAQGQPPNIAPYTPPSPGRPPTLSEQAARYGQVGAKYLPALSFTQGRNIGDITKALDEQRKQQQYQDMAPVRAQIIRENSGQPAQAAVPSTPQTPGPITQTPLPLPSAQGTYNIPAEQQPLATRAQAAGVHPPLALAIVGNEASGVRAVSPDGATGTWQLMPGTAKPLLLAQGIPAERLNSDAKIQAILKDPAINERTGLMLVKQLQEKYPGRPDLALAEYHGGPGAVLGGPNGIVNPASEDVNMKTTEYVRRGMARMQALGGQQQAQAPATAGTVAGPGAPTPQPQAPAQPYTLPPYQPGGAWSAQRRTLTGTGEVTVEQTRPTREDQAAAYIQQAVMQGGWQQFPAALAQVSAAGDQPRAERLTQIQQQASNQAYWTFREQIQQANPTLDPNTLHQQALTAASQATHGFFTGQGIGDLRDPVALTRANAAAGFVGQQLGPETKEAAQEQARREAETARQHTTAVTEATTQAQENQRVSEVVKSPSIAVYTGTDEKHDLLKRYPEHAKYGQFTKDYDAGHADALSVDDYKTVQGLRDFGQDLNLVVDKLNTIYGPGGIFEKAVGVGGRVAAGAAGHIQGWTQSDPAYITAEKEYRALLTTVARRLGSEVGRIPVMEIANYYAGVLPKLEGMPDSPVVARGLIDDIQKRIGEHITSRFNSVAPEDVPKLTKGLVKPTFGDVAASEKAFIK